MQNNRFLGWYFKHQKDDDIIAFIPGRAKSGAFIQMITPTGSRRFEVPFLFVQNGVIHAGDCRFSRKGAFIELPGVCGELFYSDLTPLESDIMGPFRYFKMECRHSVLSMHHWVSGSLLIDGTLHSYDDGIGYIEADSGTSFPLSYLWLQCNDFSPSCSVMLSVAKIPFAKTVFTGCICAVIYKEKEYRLATYDGVKIHAAGPNEIYLSQKNLLLCAELTDIQKAHPLKAPCNGIMCDTIKECCDAALRLRLFENGRQIFDLKSDHAAYEFVE